MRETVSSLISGMDNMSINNSKYKNLTNMRVRSIEQAFEDIKAHMGSH